MAFNDVLIRYKQTHTRVRVQLHGGVDMYTDGYISKVLGDYMIFMAEKGVVRELNIPQSSIISIGPIGYGGEQIILRETQPIVTQIFNQEKVTKALNTTKLTE